MNKNKSSVNLNSRNQGLHAGDATNHKISLKDFWAYYYGYSVMCTPLHKLYVNYMEDGSIEVYAYDRCVACIKSLDIVFNPKTAAETIAAIQSLVLNFSTMQEQFLNGTYRVRRGQFKNDKTLARQAEIARMLWCAEHIICIIK